MWSRIRKAAKKAWRGVKAIVRAAVRVVILIATVYTKIWDIAFGFLAWPPKRMRVHIVVLGGPIVVSGKQLDGTRIAVQM